VLSVDAVHLALDLERARHAEDPRQVVEELFRRAEEGRRHGGVRRDSDYLVRRATRLSGALSVLGVRLRPTSPAQSLSDSVNVPAGAPR
jgi:hypothetical protein